MDKFGNNINWVLLEEKKEAHWRTYKGGKTYCYLHNNWFSIPDSPCWQCYYASLLIGGDAP
jgi:hypothetical protein